MIAAREDIIELRRLAGTPEDAKIVQQIYDAAPTYAEMTSGGPSRPGAASKTFRILPEGCEPDSKHMYLILLGDDPVGFIDVIRGYPSMHYAYVGLFMLTEAIHGRGIGRRAYRALEALMAAWPGIEHVQLSVVEINAAALSFWEAMGFGRTGERTPYESGPIRSQHIFFEKPLEKSK
jgi:RimJ/RimL family protein N-acetyltransferase